MSSMMTLYVVQCITPRTWYVGTTLRNDPRERFAEHFAGYGSKWTARHGCKRIALSFRIPINGASRAENDVWMHYARIYGPERVRGGNVTVCLRGSDSIPKWILPEEFGGKRKCDWGLVAA